MKRFLTKVLTVILSVATILTVMPKMTFADDGQAFYHARPFHKHSESGT